MDSEPVGESSPATIKSVLRALDVLSFIGSAETPTVGVTEIANGLGMSKAAVHRVLASLVAKGFAEVDGDRRRYMLGPQLVVLGEVYRDRFDIRTAARPELHALVAATAETATLSIRQGSNRLYVDQVTPDRDVKMVVQIGRSYPLHAGASSKAFLAFLPEHEIEAYLRQPLEALTAGTITSPDALLADLRSVRERGYAASSGERDPGARAIAAPVFGGQRSTPLAVISIAGPADRFVPDTDETVALLLSSCERLSQRLGQRTID